MIGVSQSDLDYMAEADAAERRDAERSHGITLEADTYVAANGDNRARLVATVPVGELGAEAEALTLLARNRAVRLDPMPQRRGKSKQDFGTPLAVLAGVQRQFGKIGFDLAASDENTVVKTEIRRVSLQDLDLGDVTFKHHYTQADDSLSKPWIDLGLRPGEIAWLNSPFADLAPWAAKCESVRMLPRWTLMLCPASMGSQWWLKHVLGKCMAFGIPRIQFVGAESTYPKDLALLAYGYGVNGTGFFDWRAP